MGGGICFSGMSIWKFGDVCETLTHYVSSVMFNICIHIKMVRLFFSFFSFKLLYILCSGILLCLEGLGVVEGRVGVVTGIVEGTGGKVGVVSFVVSGGVVIGAGTAGGDGKLPLDSSAGESQSSIDAS